MTATWSKPWLAEIRGGWLTEAQANPLFIAAIPEIACFLSAAGLIWGEYLGVANRYLKVGRWQVAGTGYTLTADRAGELFFAVNDKTDINDNIGSYDVTINPL